MLIDLDDTPAAGPHRRVARWLRLGIAGWQQGSARSDHPLAGRTAAAPRI